MARIPSLLAVLILVCSAFAGEVGPEIEVTTASGFPLPVQRNVHLDHSPLATLVAFEELTPEGVSRIVLHQYTANLGAPRGRETFTRIGTPLISQHDPVTMRSMLAYLEDDPAATYPWLTWEVMTDHRVGSSFEPQGRPERVAEVKPGTKVLIIPRNLYLLVWTAPDGTLRGAWRQILTLIGFDKSAFRLTSEPAVNPAASRRFLSGNAPVILAYNRAEPSGKYSIRATVANAPLQQTLDIAPAGASAPRIVFDGTSQFIFWSMDSGGVFAQRMQNAAYGTTEKSGDAVRVYEGVLHDVTDGPNNELYAVVDEGWRFAVVRFDSSLKVLETMPFHADVATGESVRISGDVWVTPVIAYTASTPAGSRAVMRFIGARTPPTKRRSAR